MEIELKNFDKVLKIADKYPAVAEKHVGQGIAKIFVKLIGGFGVNAPVGVTGHLRDNWKTNIGRFEGSLKSGQEYSGSVEFGTRPHNVAPSQLREWAVKKGLNEFAVAKSIAKKGTKANPFVKKTIDGNSSAMESVLKETLQNITKDVVN